MSTRKQNWSSDELQILIDGVSEKWDIIKGKFSPSLTINVKNECWKAITDRINACSIDVRDVKEVKKKWQDIQSQTRKKETERKLNVKKTGGGPAPSDLKDWEMKIVGLLSENMITGIPGFTDTLESDEVLQSSSSGEKVVEWIEKGKKKEERGQREIIVENKCTPNGNKKENSPESREIEIVKRRRVEKTKKIDLSKQYEVEGDKVNPADRLVSIEEEKLKILKEKVKRDHEFQEEIISLKKEKLALKKRKNELLQEMVFNQKKNKALPLSPSLSVSPIVKMSQILEYEM